ncbi:MAG: DUF2304 domain-containing protein [Erysipelotrichales bacterium]|nr:DUF2304 domain-containing protein [Erysipelotrichales bacterium]
MNLNLQFTLLLGSFLTFIFIIFIMKKVNMNVRYTIVWIIWGVIILLLSIFPTAIDKLSILLGIALPTNTLFLIFIFLVYLMCFYLFIKVSEMNEKIKQLTYEVAITKKELDDLKSEEKG